MNSWKVDSYPEINYVKKLARLTEFLRDFKAVGEEDDIYGDGMGVDPDSIQPKYMALMVCTNPEHSDIVATSRQSRERFHYNRT
jgi:hypothetical protein